MAIQELEPANLDQETGIPRRRLSSEEINHILQATRDKIIKHDTRLEALNALDDARRAGRNISQIDPSDSSLRGAREVWLANARTIIRTTDPHAYTRAVSEAERTGQRPPPEDDQFYQATAFSLFSRFIASGKATGLEFPIQREGEIIQMLGKRIIQILTQTISTLQPTTPEQLARMVASLKAAEQQKEQQKKKITAPIKVGITESSRVATLEENRHRQIKCGARLRLFYAFRRETFSMHKEASEVTADSLIFDSVKNFHIEHARDLVPSRDFQVACQQSQEQNLPMPAEDEFYKTGVLRLFYRDFEVAREFVSRQERSRTTDLNWLIHKEQEILREARKYRIGFARRSLTTQPASSTMTPT